MKEVDVNSLLIFEAVTLEALNKEVLESRNYWTLRQRSTICMRLYSDEKTATCIDRQRN